MIINKCIVKRFCAICLAILIISISFKSYATLIYDRYSVDYSRASYKKVLFPNLTYVIYLP